MLATVVALYNTAGLITPPLVKGDAYEAHPGVVECGGPNGGDDGRDGGSSICCASSFPSCSP